MLRELREEIGLTGHGAMERLEGGLPGDRSTFFLIRDVVYRPRWSLEVEEVREFDPDRLPADATPWTARIVDQWGRLTLPSGPAAGGRGNPPGT
jgi:hypothetical protein